MMGLLRTIIFWITMVGVGTLLFRQSRRRYAAGRKHFLVTQGGAEFRLAGEDLNDAIVSVLMGGAVVDLRNAGIGVVPRKLDVMAALGGVQVIVPDDWTVRLDVHPMMGGVRDARPGAAERRGQPDLIITGRTIMGGVEVRSRMPQEERGQKQTTEEQREAA